MDYEIIIADLQEISQNNIISIYKRSICAAAATALSTLQAENEKLRAELKEAEMKIDSLLDEEEKVAFYPFGVEKED